MTEPPDARHASSRPPPPSADEALERLVGVRAAAQARVGVVSHRLRLVGGAAWLTMSLVFGYGAHAPGYREQLPSVLLYLAVGITLLVLSRANPWLRVRSHYLIAFADVPFVTKLQIAACLGRPHDAHPPTITTSMLALLIAASITSLDRRAIAVVTASCIAAEAVVLRVAGTTFADAITNLVILVVAGTVASGVATFASSLVEGVTASRVTAERLARYFSPAVARAIAAEGDAAQVRREVTVLFIDVRGFTSLAERIDPSEAVTILNEYFEVLVDLVFRHGGTLDKYLGDGMLAYFGAPRANASHARDAIRCANAMLVDVRVVNARRRERGARELRIGIGIHTGPVVVGDIGASRRREFTIIGDTVNVASRVEALSKEHQVGLVCTGLTRSAAGDEFSWRALGTTTLRGRESDVELWTTDGLARDVR